MTGPSAKSLRCASCPSRVLCVLATAGPEVLPVAAVVVLRVPFQRGETILHEGVPSTGWAFLCHGRARLTVSAEDGKRLLLHFCGAGELLTTSLSGSHSFSVTAASRCVVGFVAREHVLDLVPRYPAVLIEVHQRLEEAQHRLATRLVDLAYGSIQQRLVRVLLELAKERGVQEDARVRINLPLALRDLAEMIGASRQATCKELQPLRAKGLIEAVWPWVSLLDVERLRQLG